MSAFPKLKIGDFSKLAQVSIRTLRYYDEQGLLKPEYIDPASGYRYYTVAQLEIIHRIGALKDLGFSLENIGSLLQDGVPLDQLNSLLASQASELEQRIAQDQQRLQRVRMRLQQVQNEHQPILLDVVLKPVLAQWIIGNRLIIPTAEDIDYFSRHMFDEIFRWLRRHHIDTPNIRMTIYHAEEYVERDFDMEAVVVLPHALPTPPELPHSAMSIRLLPALPLAATTIHNGIMRDVGQKSYALLQWIIRNGYPFPAQNMGMRKIYLTDTFSTHHMDSEGIVELQIPVATAD